MTRQKVTYECINCGKTVTEILDKEVVPFCSTACEDEYRSRDDRGYYKSVAQHELDCGHGHFLTYIFEAFLTADKLNTTLMLPLMKQLTEKYKLKSEP